MFNGSANSVKRTALWIGTTPNPKAPETLTPTNLMPKPQTITKAGTAEEVTSMRWMVEPKPGTLFGTLPQVGNRFWCCPENSTTGLFPTKALQPPRGPAAARRLTFRRDPLLASRPQVLRVRSQALLLDFIWLMCRTSAGLEMSQVLLTRTRSNFRAASVICPVKQAALHAVAQAVHLPNTQLPPGFLESKCLGLQKELGFFKAPNDILAEKAASRY